MKTRARATIILVTSALGAVALATAILAQFALGSSAHAASQPMFTVTGSAQEISTDADYSEPGTVAIDTSQVPIHLANVRHYVISGTLRPDGSYDYPIGIEMAPGVRAAAMLVAMNPHTHVEVVDVGTERVANTTAKASVSSSHIIPALDFAGDLLRPASFTESATYNLVWHDPVSIKLVQVHDGVTWNFDGSRVLSGSASFPSTDLFWDGWYKDWEDHYSGMAGGNAYFWAETAGEYENDIFCQSGGLYFPTYVDVNDNEAHGNADGSTYGYTSTSASGVCSGLLGWYTDWS